jgi:uncharacterized membrane protein YkoI
MVGLALGAAGLGCSHTGSTVSGSATTSLPQFTSGTTGVGNSPRSTAAATTAGPTGSTPGLPAASSNVTSGYHSSVTVPVFLDDEDLAVRSAAKIGAADAVAAAVAAVPGTVTEVKLDNDKGNVVYKVEIKTAADQVDVKVDAGNGAVLARSDQTGYQSSVTVPASLDDQDPAVQSAAKIGAADAVTAAVGAVQGAVDEVKLQNDKGNVVYKVKVKTATGKISVKVDAGNGAVLAVEPD